jgi:ribonucleotide reductase alpha subunit
LQGINEISEDLQYRYKTVWEIPQKALIDLAIIRNDYVDQSQSMNLYFQDANYKKISSAQVYAWKKGLKTGVYYTRTRSKQEANTKLSANSVKVEKPIDSLFDCAGGGCGA